MSITTSSRLSANSRSAVNEGLLIGTTILLVSIVSHLVALLSIMRAVDNMVVWHDVRLGT